MSLHYEILEEKASLDDAILTICFKGQAFSNENEKPKGLIKIEATFFQHENNQKCDIKSKMCFLCGIALKSDVFLKKHFQKSHGEEFQKQCYKCGKIYENDLDKVWHFRQEHPPTIQCKECSQNVPLSRLNLHLNQHRFVSERSCFVCGQVLIDSYHLKLHLIRCQKNGEQFNVLRRKCTLCQKDVALPDIKQHNLEHECICCSCKKVFYTLSGIRLYCSQCQKKITLRTCSNKKIDNVTLKNEPVNVSCDKCSLKMPITHLVPHLNEHILKNCEVCNKDFESKFFKEHMSEHRSNCLTCGNPFTVVPPLTDNCRSCQQQIYSRTCRKCSRIFDTKIHKFQHYRREHIRRKCGICLKKIPISDYLSHMNQHEFFTCSLCKKAFTCNVRLDKHFLECQKELRSRKCDTCGKMFSAVKLKLQHVRKEHAVYVSCEQCWKDVLESDLSLHLKTHELHTTKCYSCTEQFPVSRFMKQFKGQRYHVCRYCRKSFRNLLYLKGHLTRCKSLQRTCHKCNILFDTKLLKSEHFKKNHNVPSFLCHVCGRGYKFERLLNRHFRIAHDKMKYKCDFCTLTFNNTQAKQTHYKRDHLKLADYVCETCGKAFYTQAHFSTHKTKVHDKHYGLYVCLNCKKSFCSSYALNTHKRLHTNIRPFACEICGEAFRHKVSLNAHNKSKHGIVLENTSFCEVCGKGFTTQNGLSTHSRIHETKLV